MTKKHRRNKLITKVKMTKNKIRKSFRKNKKKIRKSFRKIRKDFKKLTLKQKMVTTALGVGTIGALVIPIPGTSIPPALATKKYINRSIKKNKKNKKGKKNKKKN
jgi:hypothetical protein